MEALGALLYNVDMNVSNDRNLIKLKKLTPCLTMTLQVLRMLDRLLGEDGVVLKLCLGAAPEREVQHLALRCLNNMLNRYITIQSIHLYIHYSL